MASSTTKETKVEKAAVPSSNGLNKGQTRFARKAIKALARSFNTDPGNFAILRVPPENESPDDNTPELKEGDPGYDGKVPKQAIEAPPARYIVRYVGIEPVATDREIDEICEEGIVVNAKEAKGDKGGREGWSTPVHLVAVQHFDGSDMTMAPTVEIPLDV